MQSILWVLLFLLIGYAAVLLLMYLMQSKIMYHPVGSILQTPADIGLKYEDVHFETEDSLSLHGWFVPADSAQGTVLFMHGNAGNISGRLETIQLLHNLSVNTFIFDYRGYGQSDGRPDEQGTYHDATAAWNYLVEKRRTRREDIVIMGRSLGGAVAAELAARTKSAAVIIESTFTSAADLGANLYPWIPVRWMLRFNYETLQSIKKIDRPIFIAHSCDDNVVPYHNGEKLYAAANEPKVFVELKGSHAGGFSETGKSYRDALSDFLDRYVKQ